MLYNENIFMYIFSCWRKCYFYPQYTHTIDPIDRVSRCITAAQEWRWWVERVCEQSSNNNICCVYYTCHKPQSESAKGFTLFWGAVAVAVAPGNGFEFSFSFDFYFDGGIAFVCQTKLLNRTEDEEAREIKTKQFLIAMAKTNNLRAPLLVFVFAFAC